MARVTPPPLVESLQDRQTPMASVLPALIDGFVTDLVFTNVSLGDIRRGSLPRGEPGLFCAGPRRQANWHRPERQPLL